METRLPLKISAAQADFLRGDSHTHTLLTPLNRNVTRSQTWLHKEQQLSYNSKLSGPWNGLPVREGEREGAPQVWTGFKHRIKDCF